MGGTPEVLFVIDVNKEDLAVAEANKLGIPVVAVVDSNCSPDGIDYPIPGNDDASRAISFYCDLIARAALAGMSAQLGDSGVDLGESDEAPLEAALLDESDISDEKAKKIEPVSDSALFVEDSTEENDILADSSEETENSEPVEADTVEENKSSEIVENSISVKPDSDLSDSEKGADIKDSSSTEKTK